MDAELFGVLSRFELGREMEMVREMNVHTYGDERRQT
jgi:hypothetical protein